MDRLWSDRYAETCRKRELAVSTPTDLASVPLEGFPMDQTLLTDKLGLANVLTLSNETIM